MWLTISWMFNCQFWLLWRPFCGLVSLRIWCKEGFMSQGLAVFNCRHFIVCICGISVLFSWWLEHLQYCNMCTYVHSLRSVVMWPFQIDRHNPLFIIKLDNHQCFYPEWKCKIDCSHRGHCSKFVNNLMTFCAIYALELSLNQQTETLYNLINPMLLNNAATIRRPSINLFVITVSLCNDPFLC